MKRIGKGSFSAAYLDTDGCTVWIKSVDPIKECMALYFDESPYFPKVEREDFGLYKMRFYEKVTAPKRALDSDQYASYSYLRDIMPEIHCGKVDIRAAFEGCPDSAMGEALLYAYDACRLYGDDIKFEISPRNIAAENGKMVFLDVFFQDEILRKVRLKRDWFKSELAAINLPKR